MAAVLVAAASAAVPSNAPAQVVPGDSVRAELVRLRARLDSLESLVGRLQRAGATGAAADAGNELDALRAAAAAAAGTPTADTAPQGPRFESRQRSLQSLNPEISVSGDFFAHVDTDDPGADNFVMREVELSFQSSLDPYSRAKIFAGYHDVGPELIPFGDPHGDGEGAEAGGFSVEEAYVEWVTLPGGLALKLGKFNQRFGQMNRWHAHALPFQSRSLPHLAFLGEEPLGQAGAALTSLLPFLPGGAYDATVEVTRASNERLWGESREPTILGHLNGFWQLGEATDLDLGLSWTRGTHREAEEELTRDLQGVEAAFTWRPPQRARYRELVVRAGLMRLAGLPSLAGEDDDALGAWSLAELRLSPRWIVGGRFDWTENPDDTGETAWVISPTLTWWQSEWVRLRLEYDLLGRSPSADEGRLWFWASFAMGPHKHETY